MESSRNPDRHPVESLLMKENPSGMRRRCGYSRDFEIIGFKIATVIASYRMLTKENTLCPYGQTTNTGPREPRYPCEPHCPHPQRCSQECPPCMLPAPII